VATAVTATTTFVAFFLGLFVRNEATGFITGLTTSLLRLLATTLRRAAAVTIISALRTSAAITARRHTARGELVTLILGLLARKELTVFVTGPIFSMFGFLATTLRRAAAVTIVSALAATALVVTMTAIVTATTAFVAFFFGLFVRNKATGDITRLILSLLRFLATTLR
jgi:hypothetical protein